MGKNRWVPALVALVGACILAALYRYNQQSHGYEEYLVANMSALFWLPIMVALLVIRQEPSSFGLALGDARRGYRLAGLLFLAVLPFLVFAATRKDFQTYYPIQKRAAHDLAYFGYFELSYGMYLFCWEFFFRGFLLFGLARLIGSWSVFVQAIAFGIMHIGKPPAEVAASLVSGLILGVVALRAKSFVPCFVLHWAVSITFDVLVILAARGLLF
ncbi:MAG TPA: CPBP family intramembrane glutamic endopeptidase [Armatimonadota bacterium]|nr:CPBP family intramembrane glutamic endopeptidase [Armatimonadota bacterium]